MQVGCDTCREASLLSSGIEVLSGWVLWLEQSQHLDVPCSFFGTVVHTFLLSVNEEGSVWTEYLHQCEPCKKMYLAVCRTHFGEESHPHLLVGLFPGCLVSSLPAA